MLSHRKRIRIAFVFLAIMLFVGYRSYFPGRGFDAEQWQENKNQLGTKVRLEMADRIVGTTSRCELADSASDLARARYRSTIEPPTRA